MEEKPATPIAQRVKQRLEKLGLTEAAAGRAAGLSTSMVRDLGRKTGNPGVYTVAKLAKVLRTTTDWLAFGIGAEDIDGEEQPNASVPLVSWVAATSFTEPTEPLPDDEWPRIHAGDLPPGRYMALRVEGRSMSKIAVHGSIIIVRLNDRALVDRAFYVFQRGNETTFKRYRSAPPRLEPYTASDEEFETINPSDDLQVIGRVIRVISDLYQPRPESRAQRSA